MTYVEAEIEMLESCLGAEGVRELGRLVGLLPFLVLHGFVKKSDRGCGIDLGLR